MIKLIRYYEERDIDKIAKIIVDDWKIAYKGIIDNDYLENLNYIDRAKNIKEKYEKQKSIVYIDNEDVKGYCRFGENRDNKKEYGEIYALYIKYGERNNGIGKSLSKKAMQILKNKGYKEAVIWCLKENKNARKFYEKIGGKLCNERKIAIGDKQYDEVCYKYNLK